MSTISLSLALLNVRTISDKKLPFINEVTSNDSIHFLCETNIDSNEKRNNIESDDYYDYIHIPYNQEFHQRIAIRYLSQNKNVSIDLISHEYITQRRDRKDQSACQMMHVKIRVSFLHFTAMLIYRCPDSNKATDEKMFTAIKESQPDVILGDINLNFFENSTKRIFHEQIDHKQLVKTGTRPEPRRDRGKKSSLIDHFWVLPKLAHRFRPKVVDISEYEITDHHLIRVDTDLKIPSPKLTIPREVDKFRRYQTGHIDWTLFDPNIELKDFKQLNSDQM